jgi:hypothetical protein
LNHGDTDDTEIVSGDEGDLTPIHDIADPEIEEVANSVEAYMPPSEVEDQPSTEIVENEPTDEPPLIETHPEWRSSVAEEQVILVETSSEVPEPEKVKSQPTGWQQIRNFFFGGSADVTARLNNLTQSIEDAPESAVNYVLRAELYMGLREYALAQADFQRASELAEVQFELADWGLLDQVMRDRALAGLDKVQRRL